jgi:membrane protease YdiL (CAAX protease family)
MDMDVPFPLPRIVDITALNQTLTSIGLRRRLPLSVAILILWAGINAVAARATAGPRQSIVQFASHGIAWPVVCAAAFLAIVLAIFRWRDVGFRRFQVIRTARLLWLPVGYLCIFGGVLATVGLPPAQNILFIVINTCLVGFSEETMFRGILFAGLRSRFGLWTSIWIGCGVFGLIHVLNAVQTGHLTAAVLQAVAAFMTGTMFMALRLRAASLYPVILLHAAWDCLPLMIAAHLGDVNPDQPLPAMAYLAPLLVLPNFLYALYLLRAKGLATANGIGTRDPSLP